MKNKYTAIAILGVLVISVGIYAAWQINQTTNIQKTANSFMTALCTSDYNSAGLMAKGEIAWKLSSSTEKSPLTNLNNIDTYIIRSNSNWARVQTNVELLLNDGSVDSSWYELDMINDNGWKVFDIRQVVPDPMNNLLKPAIGDIQSVFAAYTSKLYSENKAEARKYLVGPARLADEKDNQKLYLTGKPQNINMQIMYGNKNAVVSKAIYLLDNREVQTILTFIKTSQGWKIAYIQAL